MNADPPVVPVACVTIALLAWTLVVACVFGSSAAGFFFGTLAIVASIVCRDGLLQEQDR